MKNDSSYLGLGCRDQIAGCCATSATVMPSGCISLEGERRVVVKEVDTARRGEGGGHTFCTQIFLARLLDGLLVARHLNARHSRGRESSVEDVSALSTAESPPSRPGSVVGCLTTLLAWQSEKLHRAS